MSWNRASFDLQGDFGRGSWASGAIVLVASRSFVVIIRTHCKFNFNPEFLAIKVHTCLANGKLGLLASRKNFIIRNILKRPAFDGP